MAKLFERARDVHRARRFAHAPLAARHRDDALNPGNSLLVRPRIWAGRRLRCGSRHLYLHVRKLDSRHSFDRCFAFTLERSEEHTSELQSRLHLVCRLLLEKKKKSTPQSIRALTSDT